MSRLPTLTEAPVSETGSSVVAGEMLEPDLRDFCTQIIDTFKWSEAKKRRDVNELVEYLEDQLNLYTVPSFYNRFAKEGEQGLDMDKLQILPCERPVKTKLLKFFVFGEPGLWRESIQPTIVKKGTNPILKPHQEEPYSYSAKSFLKGPFAIVRAAMSADTPPMRVALKEYAPEIDVSYDILIQNLMLPHPNALRVLCTYRTTRTGKVVQKMAMEPWCDYRLEDVIAAGAYGLDLVLRVGYCLGSLLYHIHCHGVKHVNINPRNILLTEEGGIYLSDLSTSRIYVEAEEMSEPANVDDKTERGRLTHPSSVSTMAHLTIQTDLFYTAPEQRVDVSRRGTDIWMLGITLLELLYSLGPQERAIRDPQAFSYMVASLPTQQLQKKLHSLLPVCADPKEEQIRRALLDIVEEVLVQQPMHRPSAFDIHQRLAKFAQEVEYPLDLNPDPDLPPIEAAKDVIRASVPYSVHEHITIKREDDYLVDLSRGEKKVRFGNDFSVKTFEAMEAGDEDGNELTDGEGGELTAEDEERLKAMEGEEGRALAS
ncbi:kinase-like domain-containing protein [Protomyces lactucae-debilis]|uniref:Kinase-like domain-containing protein n=1 Tax=Protomyces lactucae-debilis TaxID=2754530 RepID=A0A1Y2FFA0_PROLT|nr:kinase-like domain-containing protein [Protomyces lactucae-debilis]ORY82581.1 kinase-like domain-containing protein [Protomyces lactucae-debilis]